MTEQDGPRDETVLVTGGAGFIGSHLVTALAADNDVRVFDDLSTGDPAVLPENTTPIEGDVRDADAVEAAVADVDLVFHLAAVVSVDESIADPRRTHAVNVDGTLNVLEAARGENARVVVASSAAIYGEPQTVPIPEDAPTDPTSPYGLDKLAVDRYARLYHDLYGLSTVVLRPFNVYGPGQAPSDYGGVVTTFVSQALDGDPITVHGDGSQTRDFVHVSDVVAAFRLAAVADAAGIAFNVGTGERVSIEALAETVQSVTGTDSEIVYTDPRPGDIDRSCADSSAMREALGFRPALDLRSGLRRSVTDE